MIDARELFLLTTRGSVKRKTRKDRNEEERYGWEGMDKQATARGVTVGREFVVVGAMDEVNDE